MKIFNIILLGMLIFNYVNAKESKPRINDPNLTAGILNASAKETDEKAVEKDFNIKFLIYGQGEFILPGIGVAVRSYGRNYGLECAVAKNISFLESDSFFSYVFWRFR